MSVYYGQFSLSLTLKAPFLIAGTKPARYGVDVAQIRDHKGRAIIPDSHVKGVLRHAWEFLGSGADADTLFGKGGNETDNSAGQIWFSDLIAEYGTGSAPVATRVGIDPETGAAKRGSLFVVEQIAEAGEKVCFTGEVTLCCKTEADALSLIYQIDAALGFVANIGKFKSAGYGRLVGRKIGNLTELSYPQPATHAIGQYSLSFQVNKPLLVDTSRPDGNMFSGSQVVTGGTLKGALAAKLRAAGHAPENGVLGAVLSRLKVGHAFPDRKRLRDIPLDYVKAAHGHGFPEQLTDQNAPHQFDNEKDVPTFSPDFKGETGQAYLLRDYRTRVAIDEKRGAAKESALFSESRVLHEDSEKLTWHSILYMPELQSEDEQKAFDLCLNELRHGLFALGKTKAHSVNVSIVPKTASLPQGSKRIWRVVLDTPLLMLREFHLSNEKLYWAAIETYWDEVTGGSYKLAYSQNTPKIYVSQSYASGYPALRFPCFGDDRIESFVLTNPGSVFELECVDQVNGPKKRDELMRTGLPVAVWKLPNSPDRSGRGPGALKIMPQPDYTKCPYGPQNGYGAIREGGVS